jgi:hypothetical protein
VILSCAADYRPNVPQGESLREWVAREKARFEESLRAVGFDADETERLAGAHMVLLSLEEWV